MAESKSLETIKQVKSRYERDFMSKKNVVGVGIGFKERGGISGEELSLVVYVSRKLPDHELDPEDRLPPCVEGIPVDIQEVGEIKAF